MKKVYGYIRVSTKKQGEGVSLQEQKAAIKAYALRNNFRVVEWFEELLTAAKRDRPKFNKVIKLLKEGQADGVVIHKIDRSIRNMYDWLALMELVEQGVDVHFALDDMDLRTRGGRLGADIQAVVASDFIRNNREEAKKGFYGRLKQGIYPLPAPVGYLNMGKGKPKKIDPIKGPVVKKVFQLYAAGGFNLDRLREQGCKVGLTNQNGQMLSKTGISNMLNNPFYYGLIRLKKTQEYFEGKHKPIITKSLFDRVQLILTDKYHPKTIKHDFSFRRLFTCLYCGYMMIGERQKGHVYYRCQTKSCPTKTVREKDIDKEVSEKLKVLTLNEREYMGLSQMLDYYKQSNTRQQTDLIESTQMQLENIDARISKVMDMYMDGLVDDKIFNTKKQSLLKKKKQTEEKLANFRSQINSIAHDIEEKLELLKSLYSSYSLAIPEQKQYMVKILSSNRKIEGKNVLFKLNSPFHELLNGGDFSNGAVHRTTTRILHGNLTVYNKFTILQEHAKRTIEKESD